MASNDNSNLATLIYLSNVQPMLYPSSPTEGIISSTSDIIFTEATDPYLEIVIQPTDKFRFRYKSESGSHGAITGECHSRGNKAFPTVKLQNYNLRRAVLVKVSLYTTDDYPKPHVLELVGKTCVEGICHQKLDKNSCAKFQGISILNKKKDEVLEILRTRKKHELSVVTLNEGQTEEIQEEAKNLNLNAVKLGFEAVFEDNGAPVPGCQKIFSTTIFNLKSTFTGDLKICRLSMCSGKCSGEEDIILLCNKIKKDEIQIKFIEKDENDSIIWSTKAYFNPNDVHHQVAIPFKTPKYEGRYSNNLTEGDEVVVFIQLFRKSDGKCGEPRPFTYKCDRSQNFKKRKLSSTLENLESSNFGTLVENDFDINALLQDLQFSPREGLYDSVEEFIPESFPVYQTLPDDGITLQCVQSVKKDAVEAESIEFQSFCVDRSNERTWTPVESELKNNKFQEYQTEDKRGSSTEFEDQFKAMSLKDSVSTTGMQTKKKLSRMEKFSLHIKCLLKNKDILYYSPESVSVQDSDGNSLLHLAIMENKQDLGFICEILKFIQEDLVNHKNLKKQTPLHLATCGNDAKLLKLLLYHGGNPHLTNLDGNNCLHLASIHNSRECMQELLTPFSIAEKKYTPDINSWNLHGLTPFHLSIIYDSEDCMKMLLNSKADINIGENKSGKSPFHFAVELRSPLTYTLLSQPDIDVEKEDYRGYTALQAVCMKNDVSYENLSSGLKSDKNQIALFLVELFDKEKSEGSFYSAHEELTESEASDDEDFQSKIEHILNSTSEWKKLGSISDTAESSLHWLSKLDNNPTKPLLENIKRLHNLGNTKEDLIKILDMAGLTHVLKFK